MITVYGRPDSSAVARVMWCIGELELAHQRLDWGGAFGGNDTPEYRAMNPSGKIPAIKFEDGATLWESNTIIRYLCRKHAREDLLPTAPLAAAQVEAWMDWASAFADAVSKLRKAYKPADATLEQIKAANESIRPVLQIVETQLAGRDYIAGDAFSCADMALGVWAHRLWRCPEALRPTELPNLYAWIARLQARPAYQEHVMTKVSAGPQAFRGG